MRNWAELPEDILAQLYCVEDFVKFSVVCKPWKSAVLQRKGKDITFSPWLMLINSDNDHLPCENNQGGNRLFYNIKRDKSFNLKLPQTQGRRCWGSSYGWLVSVGLDLDIHLFNPLSGVQIPLPPQPVLQAQSKTVPILHEMDRSRLIRGFTQKFILASNPSFTLPPQHPQCCLVMAIFGMNGEIAFTKPGSETWTCLASSTGTEDVVFYNGQFYCVIRKGILALCDTTTMSPTLHHIAKCPVDPSGINRFYLLKMAGDLHLIVRFFHGVERKGYWERTKRIEALGYHYETNFFQAYKFNFGTKEWIDRDDLGNYAVFVGNNTSFAISTTIYTEFKGNCVYYTDDHPCVYFDGYCDMGVFDYESLSCQAFKVGNDELSKFSRPCFLMPSM